MTKSRSNAVAPAAKGQLVVGSGTDASTTLAVASTAGYVLTVDSAETTGLKWAAGGSAFKGVLVSNSAGQSISNNTTTTLNFDTETYDTDSFHSTSTNTSRLTVPSSGYYFVFAKVRWAGNSSGYRYILFRKNGTTSYQDILNYTPNASDFSQYFGLALPASANDYFELRVTQNSGGSLELRGDDNGQVAFGCYYLGA